MYAALELPHFALQAQFRENPSLALRPCALLDADPEAAATGRITAKERGKAPVLQCTPSAAARGVDLGMSATQAQARCPEIHLLYRSPDSEQRATALLHSLANAHTPDFESTTSGVVTLDLFANAAARRDPERLGLALVDALACENLRARAGLAGTPDLALLAAKLARPVHTIDNTAPGALRRFLEPLPLDVFEPSQELLETLALWGVHTFGEFLALPAAETGERLGPEAKELRERVSGDGRRPLALVRPPDSFDAKHEFELPVETLEPVTFVLRRLLDTVCSRLAASYKAAGSLTLTLKFDNGSARARTYRVPDPCRDTDLLARVVETGLENEPAAPAPVTAIRLEATPARAGRHQFGLFESGLRDPHRFAETLARLEALLGGGRVGSPVPADTHKPDTFGVTPYEAEAATPISDLRSPVSGYRTGLPLRRYRPPLPVEVALVPAGAEGAPPRPAALLAGPVRGTVADARGPWSCSGEWWQSDTRWSRQEWDIQLAETRTLYRLVRTNERWQLDGEYG